MKKTPALLLLTVTALSLISSTFAKIGPAVPENNKENIPTKIAAFDSGCQIRPLAPNPVPQLTDAQSHADVSCSGGGLLVIYPIVASPSSSFVLLFDASSRLTATSYIQAPTSTAALTHLCVKADENTDSMAADGHHMVFCPHNKG